MEHLNHLFVEAGTLMFAGMVFVFTFLSLMIVFILPFFAFAFFALFAAFQCIRVLSQWQGIKITRLR